MVFYIEKNIFSQGQPGPIFYIFPIEQKTRAANATYKTFTARALFFLFIQIVANHS